MQLHYAGIGFSNAEELLANVVLQEDDLIIVDGLTVATLLIQRFMIIVDTLAVDQKAVVDGFELRGEA